MWWALVPASMRRCNVSLAALASAREELLGELVLEVAVAAWRHSASNSVNGRPEMSIAQLARASSMGTLAAP